MHRGVPGEVALVLRLAGEFAQVPVHPAHPPAQRRAHPRSASDPDDLDADAAASSRRSRALGNSPDGATSRDSTNGDSADGAVDPARTARTQTSSALRMTTITMTAKNAASTPSTVEFVTIWCIWSMVFAGASTLPWS